MVSTMAQSLWKKRMAPNPPTPAANLRAQKLSLKRMGSPVAAKPKKGGEQDRVHVALLARKAHEVPARGAGFRFCRLLQLRHLLASICRLALHLVVARSGSATRWCES